MKTRMRWEDIVLDAVKTFDGRDDVWYSDISYIVKQKFPRSNQSETRTKLFMAVCDALATKNVNVHS